jgi:hypothetical protein
MLQSEVVPHFDVERFVRQGLAPSADLLSERGLQ